MEEKLTNDDTVFTVLDIETSGLKTGVAEIIEIAAVKIMPDLSIDYDSAFETLIRPKYFIDEQSMSYFINKISNKMVANKPYIEEVLPTFIDYIDNTTIVGHNINFDMKFINEAVAKMGRKANYHAVIDTVKLARIAYPKIINHKLDTLIDHLDICCSIDSSMRHRALYDALSTAEIFVHLVRKLT